MSDYKPIGDTRHEGVSAPKASTSWRQLGVLVLDGSESMTWDLERPDNSMAGLPAKTKAVAVDQAVRGLINRLRASRKSGNFAIASVSFNDVATAVQAPRDVAEIDPMESFDPTAAGIGGTKIHTGLTAAYDLVEQWFRDEEANNLPLSAVVLVMSDGEDAEPESALDGAAQLKSLPNTLVACSLFSTAGEPSTGGDLLEAMASEPRLYQTVFDAEQLRKFFTASLTAAAGMMVSVGDAPAGGDLF